MVAATENEALAPRGLAQAENHGICHVAHVDPAVAVEVGGGEIVKLLKTGSAWYAPASASVAMAASILRDERRMMPCACLLNGEYGLENLYMGVPAILGRGGVERIVELPLKTESRALLQKTAGAIHDDVLAMRDLGLF